MSRYALVVLALAGCGGVERTPVTKRVAVLGYAKPPEIAMVTRGERDMVEPWAASLRAASTATLVAEYSRPPNPWPVQAEAAELCGEVDRVGGVDEILVITTNEKVERDTSCLDKKCPSLGLFEPEHERDHGGCWCVKWRYHGTKVTVKTDLTSLRASSCEVVRTEALPMKVGDASAAHGVEYEAVQTPEAKAGMDADLEAARAMALERVKTIAPHVAWVFPRENPIESVDGTALVVRTNLLPTDRGYFLKQASRETLLPGIRAVKVEGSTTTLETSTAMPPVEAGDEIHTTVDMRRVAAYGSIGGGVMRAQGETHGMASGALAARWSFDRLPVMAELSLQGDVIPNFDSYRGMVGGAAGFRGPFEPFAPVLFGELGVGTARQGLGGARAYGGYAGIGAGVELWISSVFLFADIRRRWFALSDWEDGDGKPVEVTYPATSWTSTTVQLGAGRRF
ncbi:MAG: hypothetical protein IPQ07_37675 [Myxococcales bacterium]|nr:hypothetical protein [Myxococcales bacterium]